MPDLVLAPKVCKKAGLDFKAPVISKPATVVLPALTRAATLAATSPAPGYFVKIALRVTLYSTLVSCDY